VQTLSSGKIRYNAMSYHDGSVWPHDNAIISQRTCQVWKQGRSRQDLTGFLDTSLFLDLHRLPELFASTAEDVEALRFNWWRVRAILGGRAGISAP
jgi:glycogen debranching enzyme